LQDLQEGDELALNIGQFAYRRLTAASQRFALPEELYFTGKTPRFADLAVFDRMWQLLHIAGLTHTQLRGLHSLLEAKSQEWGVRPAYAELAELALRNALGDALKKKKSRTRTSTFYWPGFSMASFWTS
jgi:hypothetical protein